MTKQEEIREGIARELCYEWWNPIVRWEDLDDINRKVYYHLAGAVIKYLSSQGVVTKVDRELPEWFKFKWTGLQPDDIFLDDVKEAGYVAVEPLK